MLFKYVKFFCAFSVIVFSHLSVFAVIIDPNPFYVDKDHIHASDANPGTANEPWKTI